MKSVFFYVFVGVLKRKPQDFSEKYIMKYICKFQAIFAVTRCSAVQFSAQYQFASDGTNGKIKRKQISEKLARVKTVKYVPTPEDSQQHSSLIHGLPLSLGARLKHHDLQTLTLNQSQAD